MSGMTNLAEFGMLDHTLAQTQWPFSTSVFARFCTADPTDIGTQTSEIGSSEITGGFSSSVNGVNSNAAQETVDTTGWDDTNPITHVAFSSTSTAGIYFWTGALTEPCDFVAEQQLVIAAGAFVQVLSNANGHDMSTYARDKWMDHLFGVIGWAPPLGIESRLHTNDPGVTGLSNEFSGGGYLPQTYTRGTLVNNPPWSEGYNNAGITFSNIQSDPLRWWTLHNSSSPEYLFARQQTGFTVPPGTNVTALANQIGVRVQ